MNHNQILSQTVKTSDLIKELENKNTEILKLNLKIQELEKTRNEMLIDLESYETEFQIAEKKFIAKENELNDKLQISELEKQNLNNKIEFFYQMYPGLNSNYNISSNLLLKGNKKTNEEINSLSEKLDLFYDYYIQLENLLLNRSSQKIVLQNLDCFALKYRFNQITEAVKNILNTKNEMKNADLILEKTNNDNKSQRSHNQNSKTDSKITNKQIYFDESSKKDSKIEIPASPEPLNKKKTTFTPPNLDVNVSIDTIKTNNNVITDINKINEKVNESIQEDKKSLIKAQDLKKDDSSEKTEKLINTVTLLAEKMNKIEDFINKHAQENEKSIQKTEASKMEGRSRISATSQKDNSKGSVPRKSSVKK